MEYYPQRRKNRLSCIRYNENGSYFITICARDRACHFWNSDALVNPPLAEDKWIDNVLSPCGLAVSRSIERTDAIYQGIITVDNSVVMPNHVHLLLSVHPEKTSGRRSAAPTISSVVNQIKGTASKEIGYCCWQKSFHDHVVRNEQEYIKIWEYIDNNPFKWSEDRYYINSPL